VLPEDSARRAGPSRDLGAPLAVGRRQLDLAEDDVDDAVEDLVLVGDVVVDRHRLHPELLGQGPDRQPGDPTGVGDRDGAVQHALPAQWRAIEGALPACSGHLAPGL
jgi:hypothetical protein